MSESIRNSIKLPPEQEAIRVKCFHPSGTFTEFAREEIEQSIPQRFEKIVAGYPDRLAITMGDRSLTYGELNKVANRLAHKIFDRDSQLPTALAVKTGFSAVIGHLAILKAGNFSVRLNPSAPRARTAHMLADSGAGLILTDDESYSVTREWAKNKLPLVNMDDKDDNRAENNLGLSISPSAYAYIGYTSGSTGQTKGRVKTHREVLHAVRNLANDSHVGANDRVAVFSGNFLGKHAEEALLNGALLFPFDLRKHGISDLPAWLIQNEITICKFFPTAFRYLMASLSGGETFSTLRLIRLEGESVYRRDVRLFRDHFSSACLLINSFSSTESGTVCRYFIDGNLQITGNRVPVGYPVEGVEVLLVDESGREVGINQPGEITVRSRFLPSGYWKKPVTTDDKFRSGSGSGDALVYLTGDLGQRATDGCLEHLGRKDLQIRIRSFRVDIGEVEATLADYPGITETAVIATDDPLGNKKLVAYFVANTASLPTVTSLRNFLEDKLPDYMIPSLFVNLEKIPLTATGKIDRRSLLRPEPNRPDLERPYRRASTEVEKSLVQIWQEVLDVRPVGVHDNFFDLGGHSLAATRIVSQVIKQFQLEIPLQSLLQSPTVAEMAVVFTEYQGKKLGEKELDSILAELESLTEEEAQRLVSEGISKDPNK
ncbi:MAG TPA: non-ribosomal peptide synthetase [Methylomirabilota bacterium]|nr:non-ribosomal peptide synthetase [Methylomirabilota bacterium]